MKKLLLIIGIIFVLISSILYIYVNDYYKADNNVYELIDSSVIVYDDYIHLKNPCNIGVIFYPGGKVEFEAYLPLADKLRDAGYNVFLVEMPFNLGILDINKADDIIGSNNIESWYIMGHSLGGTVASMYAYDNQDVINGLVLLGSYNYDDFPLDKTLTIIGENDGLVEDVDYTTNVYYIEGGNHAMFGNYGEQKGDGEATISNDEQQNITVDYISNFIN